jgi:transposase-like protein
MSQSDLSKAGSNGQGAMAPPDPEVPPRAKRRQFSPEYKQRILEEADACTQRGQIGALLRREGLYTSHLDKWRAQRVQGTLAGLAPKKRGRKPKPEAAENARLRRELERLQRKVQRAETIIAFQKKLADLLGIPMDRPNLDEPSG